ncbi:MULTISPECIES: hypothetical protein [unclassified Streptomyces]|nr:MULTISPECIES: hypothetical protein [unclassified Streptomyces]
MNPETATGNTNLSDYVTLAMERIELSRPSVGAVLRDLRAALVDMGL